MKLPVLVYSVALCAWPCFAQSGDLETSYENLKIAAASNDAAQVKKLALETSAQARRVAQEPNPADASEKEAWEARVARAKVIDVYTEYALYATAVQGAPEVTVDLLATLEKQNPKSKYLDEAYPNYFVALTKTGASAQIPGIAEKAVANLPNNPDLLTYLADTAWTQKRYDRAGAYATRLVAALGKAQKPESLSAADWDKKKKGMLARGYWIAGLAAISKNDFGTADRNLRAALPLIAGNEEMLAATLFNLGLANYQLGRQGMNRQQLIDAATFSEQAAKMKSPYAQQAWTNAHLIRQEIEQMARRR